MAPGTVPGLIEQAGLIPMAELRLPANEFSGPTVVVHAKRPDAPAS